MISLPLPFTPVVSLVGYTCFGRDWNSVSIFTVDLDVKSVEPLEHTTECRSCREDAVIVNTAAFVTYEKLKRHVSAGCVQC